MAKKRDLRYVQIFNKISINSSENIKTLIKEEKEAIAKKVLDVENSIY
jgi:hypothetical protein